MESTINVIKEHAKNNVIKEHESTINVIKEHGK